MYNSQDDEGITIGLILPSVNSPTPQMGGLKEASNF